MNSGYAVWGVPLHSVKVIHQKPFHILRCHDLKIRIGICRGKGFRTFGVGFPLVPLELESMKLPVFFFDIVYSFLLAGAPETGLGKTLAISVPLMNSENVITFLELIPKIS